LIALLGLRRGETCEEREGEENREVELHPQKKRFSRILSLPLIKLTF
jgi:hypothetical protein